MAADPPRRRTRRTRPDVTMRGLAQEAKRLADDAVHRVDLQTVANQRIETELARIAKALEALVEVLGSESIDQYGKKTGTGVIGRLMRLEENVARRFRIYDGLTSKAVGIGIGASAMALVLWWLLGDRLGLLLKPH